MPWRAGLHDDRQLAPAELERGPSLVGDSASPLYCTWNAELMQSAKSALPS